MYVGIGMSLVRGGTSSSPASLFAASEPGVWYDPSDLTTLFQDDAGATPVTTPGQTVGRILDKSGRSNHATQATESQKPIYGINPIVGTRNIYTYTEQFDNAYWGKSAGPVTVAADVIVAPDGTTTADKVQETANTSPFFAINANPSPVLFSSSYTWSGYFKAAERSFISVNFSALGVMFLFNLTTGASRVSTGTATLTSTDVGNGWWRCTATFTTPASGINLLYHVIGPALSLITLVTTGTDGYGFYIWGAQLEQSATTTAYQKVVSQYEVTEAGVKSVGYLAFVQGIDDNMVTPTITPGIDKVQVFAGVRKLSDAAVGLVAEFSTNSSSAGSMALFAPSGVYSNYMFRSKGTVSSDNTSPFTFAALITNVITGLADISGDSNVLRINASQVNQNLTDQGTGNYLAYPLYIGRRGSDSTLPFNGRLYSLIVRFGANLTTGQITSTESWVNSKTGAY